MVSGGGANGGAYVDFTDANQSIEFRNLSNRGPVSITVCYASGHAYNSGVDIYVNGVLSSTWWNVPTAGWTSWGNATVYNVNLNGASNTLRMVSKYNHSPSIDSITIP